jgi:hypothetical protein
MTFSIILMNNLIEERWMIQPLNQVAAVQYFEQILPPDATTNVLSAREYEVWVKKLSSVFKSISDPNQLSNFINIHLNCINQS